MYWQKSEVYHQINHFPEVLGGLLADKQPVSIRRAKTFIAFIFWRWYFLEENKPFRMTPYSKIESKRHEEKWPKTGQFLPLVSLNTTSRTNYDVNIKLEYISFLEQPLIVDAQAIKNGRMPQYDFGIEYIKDSRFLAKNLPDLPLTEESIKPVIRQYFHHKFESWYEENPLAKEAFSLESWLYFWKEILREIIKSDPEKPFCTDILWTRYSQRLQQVLPDLDFDGFLKSSEQNLGEDNKFIGHVFYHLWLNLAYKLLIPSSLFLNILTPVFIDQVQFDYDIQDLLTYKYNDPIPCYGACTEILPTSFGKQLKEIL